MVFPEFPDIAIIKQNLIIQRVVIIIVYAILAKGVDLFIDRILRRLAKRSTIELDDKIIDTVHSPIYWTVFFLGVLHAIAVEPLKAPWQTTLPNISKSIIMLVWMIAASKAIHYILTKRSIEIVLRKTISNDVFNIFKKLIKLALIVIAFLWALSLWDISLTPLFASAGIAGIAVAMAAKDTLANFFGGMSIFMDNTFKEGDYIVLDTGERGEVVDIGMRSSRIKTRDDILITIPNSILSNTKIINESAPIPRFRIRIPVGVAYGSDPEHVEKVLYDIAINNPQVIKDPEPRVRFRLLGTSSIDFELLCWIAEPSLKGFVTHVLLKEIFSAFRKENISIPFPQMDVNLKKTEKSIDA